MPQKVETLSFGSEFGEPFRLVITYHSESPDLKRRTLFKGAKKLVDDTKMLLLLAVFLQNPLIDVSERELESKIWGSKDKGGSNVEQQVSVLRKILGDDPNSPRFIETNRGHGYKFLQKPVIERGSEHSSTQEIQETSIIEQWQPESFDRFIRRTRRGDGPDEEGDLRIMTAAFSVGIPDTFASLLEQNVRIRIILVNEALMRIRVKVRTDGQTPERAVSRLRDQRQTLRELRERAKEGALIVQESDSFPCGFVAHSSHGAQIGLFIATEAYARGPMIQVAPASRLWKLLYADWKKMWEDSRNKRND